VARSVTNDPADFALVLAILGGVGAALCWAVSSLASARGARRIGAWSTVAWVMLIGTAIAVPATVVAGGGASFTETTVGLLVVSGASNIAGLLLIYTAFSIGKVAVLAPIVSTEGAMAAVIAILLGERVSLPIGLLLAVITAGVLFASSEGERPSGEAPLAVEPGGLVATAAPSPQGRPLRAVAIALVAALLFGINLYSSARIGVELPAVWAILPARLGGAIGLFVPLLLLGRLRLTRDALPFVVIVAVCEVVGVAVYAFAARDQIAVAAVTSSQFGAMAAIASVLLFHERLRRIQVVGVALIAAGVAALAALQAA
jgi:drug/metabolite transporter (DMT)-like permease